MVTASLHNYRISPRKVRLIADMIRGKRVSDAKNILVYATKKARHPLSDLLDSAIANATNNAKLDKDTLFVKEITVGQGVVMKRFRPVSRGSAHGIKKRTSNVKLVLDSREPKAKKAKTVKKEQK